MAKVRIVKTSSVVLSTLCQICLTFDILVFLVFYLLKSWVLIYQGVSLPYPWNSWRISIDGLMLFLLFFFEVARFACCMSRCFRGNLGRNFWFMVAAILLELPSGFLVIYGFTLQTYVMLADLILGVVMVAVDGVTTLLILATLVTNLAT